jgi:hypothetical protein
MPPELLLIQGSLFQALQLQQLRLRQALLVQLQSEPLGLQQLHQ